jgi:predicted short-subunit dehydrogenase-like oxidoreductase (DUF2520 family)
VRGNLPSIFVFGPGKIGLSLSILFQRAGVEVVGIWGRRRSSLEEARTLARCPLYHGPVPREVGGAAAVFITTADDGIEEVAARLASCNFLRRGVVAFHCSGALDSGVLGAMRKVGARVGSIHPLRAIPTVEVGLRVLPGSHFTLEGDREAVETARSLIAAIGGIPLKVAGDRGLYHAAAATASNYLVTLLWTAGKMMADCGLEEKEAIRAIIPMAEDMVQLVGEMGAEKALTGPIARADLRTLRVQIGAVAKRSPREIDLFVAMARRTVDLAREGGRLDTYALNELDEALSGLEDIQLRREGGEE